MDTSLRLSAKNQLTLKEEFLQHLGIQSGDQIDVSKMPGGELRIRAKKKSAPQKKSFRDFASCLPNLHNVRLSIEEINEAAAEAAAEAGRAGLKK